MGSGTFKQLLWYLIAATRGGPTRAKIVDAIRTEPMNTNQIAKKLNLDYRTIQHHLKILINNQIFTVINEDKYGSVYFISEELEENIELFEEIWDKISK